MEVAEIVRYAPISSLFYSILLLNSKLAHTLHIKNNYFPQPPLMLCAHESKFKGMATKIVCATSGSRLPLQLSPFLLVTVGSLWQAMLDHKAREAC